MASSPHSQSDAPGEDGSVRTSSGPKRANLGTFQRKMATAKRTARQHARMMVEDRRRELGMKTVRAVQTDFKILSFAKDMLPTPEAMEEPALTPGAKPKPMTVALAAELFKTNQLHVKVQYARELVATNVEGVSNPYCKISVGDQPLRTNHVMGSCNPDWNETFTFSGQTVMEADYVVVFENWSKDAMMRPDDFCGQAELDLRAVCLGTMADRLSCELTLYVLKTSGKKDSKVDYGRLFITCWMSPEDRGRHVLSPGGNATTTKELLGKLLKTKTLPAIFHSACGTLYEEPCIVFIRVAIHEIQLPHDLEELRRAPTGIGSASLGCQPVNGLHMNAKGMQGMNKSLGRSYNRRGSMSKENKSFFGRFGVKDKDPVFSRFGNPAGLSAMSGMGENEVQFKDYDPDIDIYADSDEEEELELPPELQPSKKKKAAKYWIYCEVKNAKQEHTSKLRRVDPVTRKCKFEQSFVFPEVRPLHRRAPVQILFYFTNNKTRAGTLICKKSICMLKLLLIHQKADMEAELQWDHPSLPKKHKRFIDNPTVAPKFSLPLIDQEMDNVTVSMHVGAADMDYRPQMYNVPLVPPEIQEEMTQMLGLELDEVYQNAQKQQQSASEADNVTKYTSGDVKSPSFTEVMEHVQQAMARTDPKGYAESLMQGSKLLYGQSLAQTEEKEERGGKAAASATVKEAQTQKVTFAGDEDAEDGLVRKEVKRVGDDFVEHTVIGTSGWKMPSLMQTIVAWLLAPLIEMVMGRVQECKQRMKIRRCGTEVFLEEDLDITTAPVMERPSAKLSRCRAGRWSPNILADLNIVLPEDANAASLDVVGETSTFDLAPFPSPAFPGPFANGPAQHQAGHQTSNATYASPSSSFASRANSAPVKGLAGVLDTKHMSHLKDTLGATYSEPIELGSYASSSRPATLSPHASRGITHVVEKVKKDDVPAVLPVGSINIYYDKLYMSLPNVHYFVVFKIGPQWAKTAARVSGDKSSPNWEIRLPVYEPSVNYMANIYYSRSANPSPSDIKLFSSAKFPLSAITPNEVIVRDVKIAQAGFTGVEAKHYVHLRIQFTLVYPDWGELALTYKRPLRPAQWYTLNMDEHDAYIEKQYRKIIERWLNGTNPPLPPICVKHMLKSNREKFDLDLLLANVKRVWRSISGLLALLDGLQYIMSWKNPYLSVFAITVFGAFCLGPSVAVALLLCWLVLVAHGNRQLANAMPGSHDVNAEIDSDDDSDIEAPARNRLPAAALKRQYDGLIRVALFVQNLLDDIATGFERFAALMRWQDPVATMIFMGTCSVISIAFYLLGMSVLLALVGAFVLRPPKFRDPEPTPPQAFFARLPGQRNVAMSVHQTADPDEESDS